MSTEKTLGKLELLQTYLQDAHPQDGTCQSILKNILKDFLVTEQKVVKLEIAQKPKETEAQKRTWSPERRAKQMANYQKKGKKNKVVLQKKEAPTEPIKKYPEKIDLSKVSGKGLGVDRKVFKNSTILKQVEYDKATRTLSVIERGGKSKEFLNIPEQVKRELFKSRKPGKFYHMYIEATYGKKKETVTK